MACNCRQQLVVQCRNRTDATNSRRVGVADRPAPRPAAGVVDEPLTPAKAQPVVVEGMLVAKDLSIDRVHRAEPAGVMLGAVMLGAVMLRAVRLHPAIAHGALERHVFEAGRRHARRQAGQDASTRAADELEDRQPRDHPILGVQAIGDRLGAVRGRP